MGHPGILGKADYISAITRITRSSGTSLRSQQRTSAFYPRAATTECVGLSWLLGKFGFQFI